MFPVSDEGSKTGENKKGEWKRVRKNQLSIIVLVCMLVFLGGCATTNVDTAPDKNVEQPVVELNVSAAASLTDAAKELSQLYKQEHPEVELVYNFASSGTLQKQIEEGAPADIFISAGKKQMDALQEAGLIVDDTRMDLLGNELVLIVHQDKKLSGFEGLNSDTIERISIGTPETVPAGKYAQEALVSLNLWEALQPKLVMAKDVRQVLTYVASQNVDAGLVYRSDVAGTDNVRIVTAAPADSHNQIVYPIAIVNASQKQDAGKDFVAFLNSDPAAKVFEKYGFITLDK